MSIFKMNYDKPGKGIEKNAPEKNLIVQYFESYKRNFWRLIQTGFMYFVASLPLFIILGLIYMVFIGPHYEGMISELVKLSEVEDKVSVWGTYYYQFLLIFASVIFLLLGSGPASAGFSYITKCMANEEHAWLFKDFKDKFLENFKQSIIISIIDIAAVLVFIFDFMFYRMLVDMGRNLEAAIFISVILLVAIIYVLMHSYVYHFVVTFDNKLRVHYKNAFLMAIAKLPVNVLLNLIPVVLTVYIFTNITPVFEVILMASVWIGLTKYPMEFYAARSIRKLIDDKMKEEEKEELEEEGTEE